jgi:diguanylate cyclase (GGDEF)-like protein/PAS domain S-box-containing protein
VSRRGSSSGERATHFYRQLVESCYDAIVTQSRDAIVTSWNDGAQRLYGYPREEAVGMSTSMLIPPDRIDEERRILETVLRGQRIDPYESERITQDGRRLDVSISLSPVRSDGGEIVGAVTIARDISERTALERDMLYLAQHDPLTGLFNRTRFEQELEHRLQDASRHDRTGAVLAIDLDHFSVVNDTWGHVAGDLLLQRVASSLQEHIGDADLLARIGGDEFAVVLDEVEPGEALRVAEKLRSDIGGQWEGRSIAASVGVAPFARGTYSSARGLMLAADVALYEAKDAGRNRVVRYEGHRIGSLGGGRIRRALDENRLLLESQPIVHLATGRVVHEELLVRMIDDQGNILQPAAFLPAAERFGMVQELDQWVVGRAIELVAEGRHVAVNLSARTISDSDVIRKIARRLEDTCEDPSRLVFEITETSAVVNMVEAHRCTEYLAGMGYAFALDDFGTGFGPFSYLKRLPVKYLKIDSEFIRNLTGEGPDGHLVEAVVSLARAFDKMTIAEGVESEETLRVLSAYGVDCVQGFHVARPMPVTSG